LYLNSKSLVVARQSNLDEARRSLEAAEERHRAGVATIADVLQSRTFVSQAQLDLQDTRGRCSSFAARSRRRSVCRPRFPWTSGSCPKTSRSTALRRASMS
jgi:hypothetical protein